MHLGTQNALYSVPIKTEEKTQMQSKTLFNHQLSLVYITLFCVAAIAGRNAQAATDKYRLSWTDDPATTMTIGFRPVSGNDYHVQAGRDANGAGWQRYEVTATRSWSGFNSKFVKMTNLDPDTAYHFKVCDAAGCSDKMWFKTAPGVPSDFTFVAGGDSRTNTTPRRWGNQLVARVRPLFVLFGGDYMDGTSASEWNRWLDDWQQTRSQDGRMYPIIATHGNHENGRFDALQKAFDIPNRNSYYALNVGGEMMRIYVLNSEYNAQTQKTWLANDLRDNAAGKNWLIAAYHKPMRPHTRGKSEGTTRSEPWASTFYDYRLDLAIDSDTHMTKYTYPIRPAARGEPGADEGFIRDDADGTVYIGEGSWGAPKRPADDNKNWTLASASFYQFKLIQATPDNLHIRTVRFQNSADVTGTTPLTQADQEADPLAIPDGLNLWRPTNVGEVLTLASRTTNQAPTVSAGPDQVVETVALPTTTNLDGLVTDDGLPQGAQVTSEWSQVSGPGTVTFGDIYAVDTTASFSVDGSYMLRLTADDGELTGYDDVTITVNSQGNPTGSDLVVSALSGALNASSGAQPTLAPGGRVDVSVTTANRGNQSSGDTWTRLVLSADNQIDADDLKIGSVRVGVLPANGSRQQTKRLEIPATTPPGDYYLGAIADRSGRENELDESNNTYLGTRLTLEETGNGVDLVVSELSGTPTILTAPGSVTVSVKTTNQGTSNAVNTWTRLVLSTDPRINVSDKKIGSVQVGPLAAGASRTQSKNLVIPASTEPGTYYLGAIADRSGRQPETDETNNTLSSEPLTVIRP